MKVPSVCTERVPDSLAEATFVVQADRKNSTVCRSEGTTIKNTIKSEKKTFQMFRHLLFEEAKTKKEM